MRSFIFFLRKSMVTGAYQVLNVKVSDEGWEKTRWDVRESKS